MKHIGMMKALRLCKTYEKMTTEQRTVLQQERFRSLVIYARENSPYYARLYGGLPKDYLLSELPPVSKRELMVSSFPKMQKSSASFSQSIRNRLRLKNLQAQAKNFCRVLDIRVPQVMKSEVRQPRLFQQNFQTVVGRTWIGGLLRFDGVGKYPFGQGRFLAFT